MKRNRIMQILAAVLIMLSLSLFTGCDKNLKARLNLLSYLERQKGGSEELSQEKIDELKKSIQACREELDRTLKLGKDLGNYYRLLALEYMDLEMYGLALDAFTQAIAIYPADTGLFYHGGICAGQMSRRQTSEAERQKFLLLAEKYYRTALNLNPRYWEADYALAVLYQFEMDRPADAEPLLENLLSIRPDNIDALFLMAGVQVSLGNRSRAIEYYETIASLTEDASVKDKALENRNLLMGGY